MQIITTDVPYWISILFLLVIPIPIWMIASLAQKGAQGETHARQNKITVLLFYLSYLSYVAIACWQGMFEDVSLPPRILKFTMLPLLLFLLLFVFNLPVYKQILEQLTVSDLVGIHLFRLIGSFFIILMLYDHLPPVFALIAGTGDILTALSSIWVKNAWNNQKSYARKLLLAWNTFGLADILATSFTAFWLTKRSIEMGSQGVDILATFPFCFIPAFAPATIIFLHLSIFRKLFSKNQ